MATGSLLCCCWQSECLFRWLPLSRKRQMAAKVIIITLEWDPSNRVYQWYICVCKMQTYLIIKIVALVRQQKQCLKFCKDITKGYASGKVKVWTKKNKKKRKKIITIINKLSEYAYIHQSFKSRSWLTGSAFCALLHGTDPTLIDYDKVCFPGNNTTKLHIKGSCS